MYCPKCGSQNSDDAKFCTRCGAPLKDSSVENFSPNSEQGENQTGPEADAEKERHGFLSRTVGKVVLAVIIAGGATGCAVGGFAVYHTNQVKEESARALEEAVAAAQAEAAEAAEAEAAAADDGETQMAEAAQDAGETQVSEAAQDAGETQETPAAQDAGETQAAEAAQDVAEGAAAGTAAEQTEAAEEVTLTDDMYPGNLEGGLTREQFEIALAYAPEEMENGEISTEDLLVMVDEITYDFPEECFDGTYTDESRDSGSGYYTYSLTNVNNFLSVLTDKKLSESDMQQWDYPDEVSISGDTVTVMLYDGEWMTPLAEITDAVKGDGEITVTYNVRARGPGDYYPESTATRTAILKLIPDGGYRVDRIFTGTVEDPYQIDRQVLQIMDEYGYEEEWSFYDLVTLEEKDEAHAAINASLNEDYQAYLDYSEKVTGKTVDEIRDSTNAKDYNGAEAGVTNIENGILSIKYKDMIMEGDVTGTWYYGLTYSLETGEQLRITDLTDLSDEELLSQIKSAMTDYITSSNYMNQSELISKVNALTLDDFGSGYDFWDTYSLSFCVDDGEINVLVPPGTFFDSVWSNQVIPTGIYIPGAEARADERSADYILPDSSTSYLSMSDIIDLTSEELRLARNEIYARNGRKFDDPELSAYFNSKSWYQGTVEPEDFEESMLNEYEKENIKLIQAREEEVNGETADTSVTGSVREIYEQVLKDVQDGNYAFQYAVIDLKGYQYFLTDMNGDGIEELIVGEIYNTNSGAGVGVFDFYDTRVFSAEPQGDSYALQVISGELDMLAAYYAGDGNGFYANTDFGRGTGLGEFHRITLQSGSLSVGSMETYSMADDSWDQFEAENPQVTWYDISDLSGLG